MGQTGQVVQSPAGLIDLYPTLTELCGVPQPKNLQGQSLVPMLKDPSAKGRGWALTHVQRRRKGDRFDGYSLRTPRWRYTEWDGGEAGRELYDREKDPLELTNLAGSEEHRETVNELSAKLEAALPQTFPGSGERPKLKAQTWAPNLTDP